MHQESEKVITYESFFRNISYERLARVIFKETVTQCHSTSAFAFAAMLKGINFGNITN